MNQSEDFSSSPYPCNALANARTRHVIAELNGIKPEFVVHLGDIINPVPELPTYEDAANHFKTLVADLEAPLHVVPGNHDIGDKPVSWAPAGRINDEHIALYESHFGPHYFSFDSNGLHIIVLNTPLMNSGLAAEAEQREWLEQDLEANKGKRTFLALHYPPFVSNADESSSYDNIDEPARSWFIDIVKKYKPEGMFCGHVHNFWYDLVGETEMYILPSTAFVRHDYSEFFRIEPGDQYGRNDEAKLGYFIVRVYEHGHVIENVRTYGRTLAEGKALADNGKKIERLQSKETSVTCVGLDMRQPWAEELEITASGALEEFERKLARNDYPVLALWEIGLRRLRVPIQDLTNDRIRGRMEILAIGGHQFQVYCYGVPEGALAACLLEHSHLVDIVEIVIGWDTADDAVNQIAKLKEQADFRVYLSRVNRKDAAKHTGGKYNHFISHGFTLAEVDELSTFFASHPTSDAIDGTMFAIPRTVLPRTAASEAAIASKKMGKTACLYIRSNSSSPAEGFNDDVVNSARAAEAVVAAIGTDNVDIILDTFADTDRGYFARTGLVDRRFNPKIGSHILGNLISHLSGEDWSIDQASNDDGISEHVIVMTNKKGETSSLVLPAEIAVTLKAEDGQVCYDLTTGEMIPAKSNAYTLKAIALLITENK